MTPWTITYQAPWSTGFSRQEYWSVLSFPSPGDLPNPGIKPGSPTQQADSLSSEPPGKHLGVFYLNLICFFWCLTRLRTFTYICRLLDLFVKCTFKNTLKNWTFVLFLIFCRCIYILWIGILCQICFAGIFSSSVAQCLLSINVSM